jgi:uncharacterized protein
MDSSPDPERPPDRPRTFFHRRRLRRWLIFVTALVPLWLLISLIVAHRLTHRARPRFDEPTPRVDWASFESHRLATRDGHELGAWFAEGRTDSPSVVLLHGNGGDRASCLPRAELLARAGYAVLPVTLRAHGDSTGDFNDLGYSARHDVVSAVEFLERRRPGRPIFVLGASLGAAAATFASSDLGPRVAGYLLEAPYDDLKSAVRNRTSNSLPIGLEWVAYQGLLLVSPLVLPDLDKISPRDAIGGVPDDVPVLLIAGRHDEKARPEQVEALFDRVRSHARFVVFENAGHLRYQQADPDLYRSTVFGFLKEATTRKTAAK